jgi:hypothetical protein
VSRNTVSPAGYATLVAEDRERADTFNELLSAGNRTDAGALVFEALDNIRKVAKRSGRHGDEVQLQWCGHLHQKLKGE